MKTPDEIKKGLKVCCPKYDGASWISCYLDCPYKAEGHWCKGVLHTDALAYIQQLESTYSQVSKALCDKENAPLEELLQEVGQLKSRLAQAERERDALAYDFMLDSCEVCMHGPKALKDCLAPYKPCIWHWRGVCEENTKEDSNRVSSVL